MKRLWSLGIAAITFLMLLMPSVAHADVNNFTITDFNANYILGTGSQAGMTVEEHLAVNFSDYNHGILRALPQKYNGRNMHLWIQSVKRDGAKEPFTTYTSNGNKVLQIGSPDQTITGAHTYDINYRVEYVIRFVSGHDELDWNTNGTEWGQPFNHITAHLEVPNDIAAKLNHPACYTGYQGSTAHDCTIETRGDETIFTTTRVLSAGENMTFVANFPTGTFHPPTAADWWRDNGGKVAAIVLPILLAFGIGYRKWHKDGKDIKGRGTIIPEYAPPTDLRPAEADVVNHYKLGKNAISATIIDLAIRKYLKIIEGESKGVLGLGKHKTYSLQRLPQPAKDSLKPYEQQIYDALFPTGDTTEISALKNKFYLTSTAVQKALPKTLTADGYFPGVPGRSGWQLAALAVAFLLVGTAVHSVIAFGFFIGAVILFFFYLLMPRRTQKGVDAKDTLAGLKMYMETAEKDRIAMLQSPDAPYAEKSTEPTKTVELFEKLLPYAMILGVEKQWAKQFEGIYTTPPDWYSGNWTAFNAGYLVGSLNDSMSAMNASFAAPSSSGAGGGGGFSGGGGGGGGGGGW